MMSRRSRTAVLPFLFLVFLLDGIVLVIVAIVTRRTSRILTAGGHGLVLVSVNLTTLLLLHLALMLRTIACNVVVVVAVDR